MFVGAATAVVTPMNKDFSVNFGIFQALIQRQIERGISAVVVCGTTGESSTLSDTEQSELIRRAVEVSDGRVPIIGGVASNCTLHACTLARNAEKAGADAILALTPYYNKTSQSGLIRHFAAISEACSLPIIVYNVPSRTGMSVTAQSYAKLSAFPNIVAVKDASADVSAACELASADTGLHIYSGNDDLTLPMLSIGASGVISVLSNILPAQTSSVCRAFFDGESERARREFLALIPLINALFCEVNPIPIKHAMNYLGFDVGACRMPLVELGYDKRFMLELLLDKITDL